MLKYGIEKLDEQRLSIPNAGGLVIAPNIEMAEYMADILEKLEGERPTIVHSNLTNSEQRIAAFRNTTQRWIVSVAMISEGVDIKRLRVMVYLPNARTELAFRQAVGRVVRSLGKNDMSNAYVIMPILTTLEKYAERIEKEMGAIKSQHLKNLSIKCVLFVRTNALQIASRAVAMNFLSLKLSSLLVIIAGRLIQYRQLIVILVVKASPRISQLSYAMPTVMAQLLLACAYLRMKFARVKHLTPEWRKIF